MLGSCRACSIKSSSGDTAQGPEVPVSVRFGACLRLHDSNVGTRIVTNIIVSDYLHSYSIA